MSAMAASDRLDDLAAIQAVLAARGYRSGRPSLRSAQPLSAGSAVVIQFGDRFAVDARGRPQLVVSGIVQINADDHPSPAFVTVSIEKSQAIRAEAPIALALDIELQLAVQPDLRLPDELWLAAAAIQSGQAYRHLQNLLQDAHETLRTLPIDRHRKELSGPGIRIEARLFGDLALGRTGLIRPCEPAVSQGFMRVSLAACEWLQGRVLPEFRLVLRHLIAKNGLVTGMGPPQRAHCCGDGQVRPSYPAAASVSAHETLQ